MANASTRDARAGFAIYVQFSGGIQLDQLNARLEQSGYGPVAPRTFNHYRNLVKAGFNRYISINRFDVARASQAYGNMSSLGRYRYRSVNQEVGAILLKASNLFQAKGRVIEISDVGAIIEFRETEDMQGLRLLKPSPGDSVVLHYPDRSDAIKGRIVDADLMSTPVVLETEHASLTSVEAIGDATRLPASTFRFQLVPEDDSEITLDVLGRRLHHFFDLIEGVRALHNEVARHSKVHTYASPPIVTHMRLSSPAILLLQLAPEVVYLLSWSLIGSLLSVGVRKQWYQGTFHKSNAKLLDVETELRKVELERRSLEQTLRADMTDSVRSQLPHSTLPDEELQRIILAYVLPSLRSLAQTSLNAIDVDITEVEQDDVSGNGQDENEDEEP